MAWRVQRNFQFNASFSSYPMHQEMVWHLFLSMVLQALIKAWRCSVVNPKYQRFWYNGQLKTVCHLVYFSSNAINMQLFVFVYLRLSQTCFFEWCKGILPNPLQTILFRLHYFTPSLSCMRLLKILYGLVKFTLFGTT